MRNPVEGPQLHLWAIWMRPEKGRPSNRECTAIAYFGICLMLAWNFAATRTGQFLFRSRVIVLAFDKYSCRLHLGVVRCGNREAHRLAWRAKCACMCSASPRCVWEKRLTQHIKVMRTNKNKQRNHVIHFAFVALNNLAVAGSRLSQNRSHARTYLPKPLTLASR